MRPRCVAHCGPHSLTVAGRDPCAHVPATQASDGLLHTPHRNLLRCAAACMCWRLLLREEAVKAGMAGSIASAVNAIAATGTQCTAPEQYSVSGAGFERVHASLVRSACSPPPLPRAVAPPTPTLPAMPWTLTLNSPQPPHTPAIHDSSAVTHTETSIHLRVASVSYSAQLLNSLWPKLCAAEDDDGTRITEFELDVGAPAPKPCTCTRQGVCVAVAPRACVQRHRGERIHAPTGCGLTMRLETGDAEGVWRGGSRTRSRSLSRSKRTHSSAMPAEGAAVSQACRLPSRCNSQQVVVTLCVMCVLATTPTTTIQVPHSQISAQLSTFRDCSHPC